MTPTLSSAARRAAPLAAALVAALTLSGTAGRVQVAVTPPPPVFELELPDANVSPTDRPELTIATADVGRIVIHLRRPVADEIDYSQIAAHFNGRSAGPVASFTRSDQGKVIAIDLKRYPGWNLSHGRNSVEVSARNRRGRVYYASFVLRTATESRNEGFTYKVETAGAKQQVPPELVLLEPEREIVVPAGRPTLPVRVAGVATAATTVSAVTMNGQPLALKRGTQIALPQLGLTNEANRAAFDLTPVLTRGTTQLTLEATDAQGNRTRLEVPVRWSNAPVATERPEKFAGRKYALVVGVSKYKHAGLGKLSDLRFADADAVSIHKFLQTPAGGRFAASDMLLLTNEGATADNLRRALADFATRVGPEDLFFVFIASHGAPDPFAPQNIYFVAHDTHVDQMPQTGIAMSYLRQFMEGHVRARRLVLVVDTCHSAGLTGSRGEATRGIGNNLVNLYIEKLLYQEEGQAVLTSSDLNELSQESERWGNGHGVFTHFLLEGMRGKADSNQDRLVTVGELFRFVRQRVRLDTQFRQNPRMLPGTNENLTLAADFAAGQ